MSKADEEVLLHLFCGGICFMAKRIESFGCLADLSDFLMMAGRKKSR